MKLLLQSEFQSPGLSALLDDHILLADFKDLVAIH